MPDSTSQRSEPLAKSVIEHWHAWIDDATIADAILDRIMQRNHRFVLTGDSLRPEKSKPAKKEKNIDPS